MSEAAVPSNPQVLATHANRGPAIWFLDTLTFVRQAGEAAKLLALPEPPEPDVAKLTTSAAEDGIDILGPLPDQYEVDALRWSKTPHHFSVAARTGNSRTWRKSITAGPGLLRGLTASV